MLCRIEFFCIFYLLLDKFLIGLPEDLVLILQILHRSDEVLSTIICISGTWLLAVGAVEVVTLVLALPATDLGGGVALGLEVVTGEAFLHGGDALADGGTALLGEEVCLALCAVLRGENLQHEQLGDYFMSKIISKQGSAKSNI